jgi:hypothetical protein
VLLVGWWLALFLCAAEVSAYVTNDKPFTIYAKKFSAEIKIDGKLSEPVWDQIPPITQFIQTNPVEGQPASERTEVRIFYDDRHLYFGFRCYDSEPDKIVARLDAHDARTFSDSVDILLDTFHDLRTAYFFSINARGVQFDATVSETKGGAGFDIYDKTWDGVWQSAAVLDSEGWTAEVAIPFKILRFPERGRQTWGINLSRDIVRKNEVVRWFPVSRFDNVMKPSKSGVLEGLEDIRPGRDLEIIPFALASQRSATGQERLDGFHGTGGLDVRYGLTPNLKSNFTLNPDFAQTEADEINISLSRFELFFPEKRAFFVEGADFFKTPLNLFFSRRIGLRLPDGSEKHILGGAKLTGKVGPYSIGLLETRTEENLYSDPTTRTELTSPGANFFVLRLQRDIFQKSSVGFITVNRDEKDNLLSRPQRVHGIDVNLVRGKHVVFTSQAALSTNPGTSGSGLQRAGLATTFSYDSNLWQFFATSKYLGKAFDVSYIGFEPETDRIHGDSYFLFKPFINRYGIRQFITGAKYGQSTNTAGGLEDSRADYAFFTQFQNFWAVNVQYSYSRVRFFRFTEPTPGDRRRLSDTKVYVTPYFEVSLETNTNRPVYGVFAVRQGKFVDFRDNFAGRNQTYDLSLNARLAGRTKLELHGLLFREFFMNHRLQENRGLVLVRVGHQFTPKLRARILAQFDKDKGHSRFNLNSLIAYDFTARSALFIGYNHDRQILRLPQIPGSAPDLGLGRQAFVKFSYLFGL